MMNKEECIIYIKNQFENNGMSLNELQLSQFFRYYELLVSWNEKINLTAITEFKDVVLKHFIDSTVILSQKKISQGIISGKIIDVGTGAGFPGIPLKILKPELKLTLLDSLQKRVKFLENVCEELDLKDVKCVAMRAEDAAHNMMYREKYDLCISRAVANLSTLSEYCLPFIHKSGYFIAYKSADINEELQNAGKAIKVMGGEVKDVTDFSLGDSNISRSMIVIRKVTSTPAKYPRKAGTPGKHPIQ